ncbi:MAG: alpha/beta fold hydrolase, partial [Bacilli bacterium]
MKISAGFLKTKDYKTFYKIYGEINNDTTPLIVLCGGPGSPFYSYEGPFKELAESGLTIVFYNQHGCGFSTINKDKYKELYTFESFEEELVLLVKLLNIKKYHLLGHSWGGMLALHYVTNKSPKDISSLILFSTLPSTKIWNQENSRSIENYPISYKKALLNEFEGKKYNEKMFTNASNRFVSE